MRSFFFIIAAAAFLSGCGSLPAVGPTTSDVLDRGLVAETRRYEVVDVSGAVTSLLAMRAPDSLLSRFGDYRPPVESRIGVGDSVSVTVWEAAAGGLFSAPLLSERFSTGSKSATLPEQAVGRDGSISVPYGGRVRVVGQSVAEVQHSIEKALEGKAIQPQVLVNVVRPVSHSVTVTGEVAQGARVPLSVRGDRLMDVIAAAGGLRAPVNETFVQLSRGSRTARVALARVVRDPRENIFLRPDDVVTLVREPQTFVAYGATGRNAEIPFDADGIMLSQAIAKAGGLLDQRADPTGVFILRYEPHAVARTLTPGSPLLQEGAPVPMVYRLNLRDPNGLFLAQKFPIFARDTIYVSNAPFTEAEKAFYALGLLTGPMGTAATLYGVTK